MSSDKDYTSKYVSNKDYNPDMSFNKDYTYKYIL